MGIYTEKVAKVFNNALITQVCLDIDNEHLQSEIIEIEELKQWLPMLITSTVDLSIKSLSNKPYQEAYDFVMDELYKEKITLPEVM
jgi:hypothetical protein